MENKFSIALVILAACLFTGCGTLIPKKVELGQDKVQTFPEPRWKEREIQRQAAQRAKDLARETLIAAVKVEAPPTVTAPAAESAEIADALADVVGPPSRRSILPVDELADKTRATVARQDERVDDFRGENNENAGKKIEGTGFIQVSYFAWVGGFLLLGFLAYVALKVVGTLGAAANPVVGLGVNAVSLGAKGAAKALGQVVKGGNKFKALLDKQITDPETLAKVKDIWKTSHNEAQDDDVKNVINHLTKKD